MVRIGHSVIYIYMVRIGHSVIYFYVVRIGHSVIYFYVVRIGHSVFYFYMVRNGHNVSTSIWYEMVIVYFYFQNGYWAILHMVRNGYGAKYIWYEMVSGYGTKLQFCGTKWYIMERNGYGSHFVP